MAGKFNFTAKIGLDSAEFHKGVNKVRSSLNGLKTTFLQVAGALGAGLGLTQLIGSVRTTATELSNTMNTLKNVSYQTKAFKDGTEEVALEINNFAENLSFVKKLAKDYHQDLVAITDNYAKFIAACKKTNMGLEEQRFVFESLTKAAAFYHLSADRTNDMMNAVVQMMSKGKVAAEELRRQLGNTLPGAFNMMAAALGVSTAKLEDMMKNGEVISSEVLPRFAAMLNSVTKNIEFDSIQASMNDLKNTWYEFVEKSGAEELYKNMIDGAVSALQAINNNINGIKSTIIGLVTFLGGVKLFSHFKKEGQAYFNELEKEIATAKAKISTLGSKINLGGWKPEGGEIARITKNQAAIISKEDLLNIREYNKAILEMETAMYKMGQIPYKWVNGTFQEVAKVDSIIKDVVRDTDKWSDGLSKGQRTLKGIEVTMQGVANSIKNFLKSNWIMLVIAAITALVSYFKKIREEAERIANITKEYENNVYATKKHTNEQAALLKSQVAIVEDVEQSEASRLLALKEVNKALGLIGNKELKLSDLNSTVQEEVDGILTTYTKIGWEVEKWIRLTKTQALIQLYASQVADATFKKNQLQNKITSNNTNIDLLNAQATSGMSLREDIDAASAQAAHKLEEENKKLQKEIEAYSKIEADALAQMKTLGVSLADIYGVGGSGGNDDVSTLAEIFKKYNKDEKELANQLKETALTQEKHDEAFDKLVEEYWKKAAATGELSIEKITEKFDSGKTLTEMEKWYYELAKNAREAATRALLKEAQNTMEKVTDEAIKEQEKLFEEQLDDYLEKQADKADKGMLLDMGVLGGEYKPDKRKNRNTLFDYDKTGSEETNDELEQTKEWLDSIKENYKDLIEESTELGYKTAIVQKELDELSELYQYAAREAKTLEAAMNYQKVVEDIKDVKKEINNLTYSGIKDFATSIDRVVSAWDTLEKTMNDSESTGWEKFMSIFNLITQVVDSAIGVYQTITTIQELQAKLGAAKIAEQTALNQLLKEEIALRMAAQGASQAEIAQRFEGISALLAEKGVLAGILGLKQAEGAQTATNTALKGAEAGVTAAAASASAGEAVANATASGAKMPYPLNLIAIATGIAAVIAALATMKKFAHGGIVGGNSTHGDRNIARVNSGEMILNKAQQGTLWGLLNGKGSIGGNVEFKIRGADLVGTINNYGKKISK